MRKQTKLVAVASAAALLAVGASMTSFAATGWVEEDGQWFYYDKDGNRVEDTWKKSGENWYWLASEEGGGMAVDTLVEDGDDTYYVDSNGVMVRNTWVKVVNEEQDDEDEPAEYIYYYMQSNGKAYKTKGDSTKFKTIDGKRYAFDEDGKMLYGWVDGNHDRISDDEWDDQGVYYLGQWDDGAMKTGWQKITVPDNDDDEEEKDFWFYFKANGKKERDDGTNSEDIKTKTINGKKYAFDSRGVMVSEWTIATGGSANSSSSSNWRYFNSPEDGARMTKGWFKVVAPDQDNDNTFKNYDEGYGKFAWRDADEENERWYYADGDGKLASGEIKKIKGKYYAFRPDDRQASDTHLSMENQDGRGAAMLSGLVFMQTDGKGKITAVWDDDVTSDDLDDIIDQKAYDGVPAEAYNDPYTSLYYFGSTDNEDSDGSMKTGNVTVNLDGGSYNFLFRKSGGKESKGYGVTGIEKEKYVYKYGMRIKAGADDKYRVVKVWNREGKSGLDIGRDTVGVMKVDSADLRNVAGDKGQNKDGETVMAVAEQGKAWPADYFLVNASGSICKKKTAAKDGSDWYFYVNKDQQIVLYSNSKVLKDSPKDNYRLSINFDRWDDWRSKNGTVSFEDGIDDEALNDENYLPADDAE